MTQSKLPPDKSVRIINHLSGGKDSVATALYLRELGYADVLNLFCDTGHEADDTYRYLDLLEQKYGFGIVRWQPLFRDLYEKLPARHERRADEPLTMESLAAHKMRFPSPMRRFCTQFLKLYPARRWHREHGREDDVISCGVRAEESKRRAAMSPWAFDDLTQRWKWFPIFEWTLDDVWACHARHGVPRNPLYDAGMSRVGCFPCIMARKSELTVMARTRPEAFQRLYDMERRCTVATNRRTQLSFFSADDVSSAYRSHTCPNSGRKYPDAMDVWRWALSIEPKFADDELFWSGEDEPDIWQLCDIYGACE